MELTRINNRMKSILLHDEEWDFFIDALRLASQSNIQYQSSTGAPEHLILVNVDGGDASTAYELILDGGVASTRFVELTDGYYTILTPGVYGEDGTDVVKVENGIPQFQMPLPEGIEQIIIVGDVPLPEGFKIDSIKALLFSNNATSFFDIMTILCMYGLAQNRLQISPGDVAEYTYNVFFYKGVTNEKTVYMCPMYLLPEHVIEAATMYSPAKVNGDYIISAIGQELATPIPILSYRNGVVEFDTTDFPSTTDLVVRVTIKRVIHNYRKGDFSKTPMGDAAPVDVTKNALPIISFEHTWLFSALIGGTQELPWNGDSSPLLVTLQGNDSYTASLVNVSTLSGDGISLPDAVGGVVTGTAPGVLRIAYGTNQASTTNTALLVIETEHCGRFTFNLVQLAAGFGIETVNYQENQLLNWYNVPLAYIQPAYGPAFISKFPYRYGTVILFTAFAMPQFRLVPYSPYDIDFSVSPVGTDGQRTVQDTNYQQFPVDSPSGAGQGSAMSTKWWQLHADPNNTTQPEAAVYSISADVTPQGTSEQRTTNLRLNIAWFAMFDFDLATKTFNLLSCNGIAYLEFNLYSNLAWWPYFVQPGNFQLMDTSWFTGYTPPYYYDTVEGHVHVVWSVPETLPTETVAKNTSLLIRLPDGAHYVSVRRPIPQLTFVHGDLIVRGTSGGGYELEYLDLYIRTNFVNTNIWLYGGMPMGSSAEMWYFPMLKLAHIDPNIDTAGGASLVYIDCDYDVYKSQGSRSSGWAPIEGDDSTPGSVAWFNRNIVNILRDAIVDYRHIKVVARYDTIQPSPAPVQSCTSNLNGFDTNSNILFGGF